MVPTIHAYGDLVGGSAFYGLIQQSSQNCAHVDGGIFTGLRVRRGIGRAGRRAPQPIFIYSSVRRLRVFSCIVRFRGSSMRGLPHRVPWGCSVMREW